MLTQKTLKTLNRPVGDEWLHTCAHEPDTKGTEAYSLDSLSHTIVDQ